VSWEPDVMMTGFHHRAVSMEELEAARRAVEDDSLAAVLALGVRGAVGVITCHRVELYVEGVACAAPSALFRAWCGGGHGGGRPIHLTGTRAARHLLRVAAGLESAVLGDDNVLGQLRDAYRAACQRLHAGPLLHRLFHAAFRTGKRVRSETDLASGGRSVAGEAVSMITRRLGGVSDRTILVLGAGEMARTAAQRLAKRGAGRLLISNRSCERARKLAADTGGTVVPWSWRTGALRSADALLVGTGAPGAVFSAEELRMAARARGALLAVDLSLPRNLEPPAVEVPELELIDLAGLTSLLEGERERRLGAVAQAESVVEQELEGWLSWAWNRRNRRGPVVTPGEVVAG